MTPAPSRRWPGGWAAAVLAGVIVVLGLSSTVWAPPVAAHPLNTSAVLVDVMADQVTATVELLLNELGVAENKKLTPSSVLEAPTLVGLRTYVRAHLSATDVSGRASSKRVSGGRGWRFVLHYDAVIDKLMTLAMLSW